MVSARHPRRGVLLIGTGSTPRVPMFTGALCRLAHELAPRLQPFRSPLPPVVGMALTALQQTSHSAMRRCASAARRRPASSGRSERARKSEVESWFLSDTWGGSGHPRPPRADAVGGHRAGGDDRHREPPTVGGVCAWHWARQRGRLPEPRRRSGRCAALHLQHSGQRPSAEVPAEPTPAGAV